MATRRRGATRSNLPNLLSTFVGRERELAEVVRLVRTTRLVTLTGAGGAGKTRLAIEAALRVVGDVPGGAWLVELAPVADPALVPQSIADALGVREETGRPLLASIRHHLGAGALLLVVDNCEHLVDACASILHALLRTCPGLRVLATSREPLGVAGEVAWRVPPLTLPYPEKLPPIEALLRCEAVQLFVERAGQVRPGFALDETNDRAVAEICYRLDGLPLAIELAAARVAAFSPVEIAGRLGVGTALLTSPDRTATSRHRTLRAAIDWSYGLLTRAEKALLCRLGVFVGGWTIEAVEDSDLAPDEVVAHLAKLVDRSLVVAEQEGDRTRYRLLETIREYALERLAAAGVLDHVRARHAAYFADLVAHVAPRVWSDDQVASAEQLARDHDNIRAALVYLASGDDPSGSGRCLALRLAGDLTWYWSLRNYWTEGRRWLERLLEEVAPEPTAARLTALLGAAWFAHVQNDGAAARRRLDEADALAQELGDERALAWSVLVRGRVAYFEGDYAAASALGARSLAMARRLDDPWVIAWALQLLARAAELSGDYRAAQAHYEEALAIRRRLGDPVGIAMVVGLLGMLAYHRGDLAAATTLTAESLELVGEVAFGWVTAIELAVAACVVEQRGDVPAAVRLSAAARRLSETIGAEIIPDARAVVARILASAPARIGEAALAAACEEGRAMSTAEAIAYAVEQLRRAAGEPAGPLSSREAEVAALIARGLTNRQIAAALVISPRTADRHVANILDKLGVGSRADVAAWARQRLVGRA
jgi:predicted ATPase/DNA-binding CsgD family transcriptional regulator